MAAFLTHQIATRVSRAFDNMSTGFPWNGTQSYPSSWATDWTYEATYAPGNVLQLKPHNPPEFTTRGIDSPLGEMYTPQGFFNPVNREVGFAAQEKVKDRNWREVFGPDTFLAPCEQAPDHDQSWKSVLYKAAMDNCKMFTSGQQNPGADISGIQLVRALASDPDELPAQASQHRTPAVGCADYARFFWHVQKAGRGQTWLQRYTTRIS